MKKRIVIAGFGDTGLLAGIDLAKDFDVIGISAKPCLVSGQELGTRLTRPKVWKSDYLMPFHRYKKLDNVTHLQGQITSIDTASSSVYITGIDGSEQQERYDALLISSGVSNGFWRDNKLEDIDTINANIDLAAQKLAKTQRVAIIGGGATGVSVCSNLKEQYPAKDVHLFYSQEHILAGYHPKVQKKVEAQLKQQGIHLHANHRAVIPEGFSGECFTAETIHWRGDQEAFKADIVLWAVGNLKPNNTFIPQDMLNEKGFVKTTKHLQVSGHNNVFTVGDIAASDPNRSSARNAGFLTVANNIRAHLQGNKNKMKTFKASQYRWGSVLGVQKNGMRVFTPKGGSIRISQPLVRKILFPFFVRKLIYKGVRKAE
ncbi:MAG: FAD-dependent oxidoreductase [Pseudomonadales bacterium]|nr:FAD-dependent oxidoreductase [Pseudomonadales bacterium]